MSTSPYFNLDFNDQLKPYTTSLNSRMANTMQQRLNAQMQRQMDLNFNLSQDRLSGQSNGQLNERYNNFLKQHDGGFFGDGTELGMNLPTAQLAFGAAQSLSNMWNAYQANKMAKKQFNFTRDFANANLENQTKQYNTTLADIARTRGQIEGQSQAQQDAYYNTNKLESKRI